METGQHVTIDMTNKISGIPNFLIMYLAKSRVATARKPTMPAKAIINSGSA